MLLDVSGLLAVECSLHVADGLDELLVHVGAQVVVFVELGGAEDGEGALVGMLLKLYALGL